MAFADINVKLDGTDLATRKIRTGDIILTQPMWDHHWFSIECLSLVAEDSDTAGGTNEALDSLRDALGSRLEFSYRPRGGDTLTFHGLVTTVQASRQHLGAYSVILQGHSPTIQLDGPPRKRIWLDSTTGDVLKAATADHNAFCEVEASGSRNHVATIQHDETDFEFITRLCQQERIWSWYDGEKFRLADTPAGPERQLTIRGAGDGTLMSFSVTLGTAPGKQHARAWDRTADQALTQSTDELSLTSSVHAHVDRAIQASDTMFATEGDVILGRNPLDVSGLEADLTDRKHSWAGQLVKGEGASDDPGVVVGGLVEIEGMSADDGGRYIVTSVTHSIQGDGSGYRNNFTCVPEEGAAPPRTRERPTAPVIWGAVVVNTDDPDGLGRIQVEFNHSVGGAGGPEPTPWIRVAQGHSGENWGAFALPELGDEVLVAALDGDQEDLVVLGSVPNGSGPDVMGPARIAADAVGAAGLAEGLAKVFLTKSGNQIVIVDEDGSETIEISSPDGQNQIRLSLDGGPKIDLTSDGDVSITAAGAINLKSDSDIIIDAKGKLDLLSGSDAKLKASGNTQVEAGMKAGVKGMEAALDGSGKVTCNPAGVEIKGTLIRLN